MDALVNRVRAEREARGMRPSELAARAGLSRQGLHKIETGAQLPGVPLALRLASALGCTVEALFSAEVSTLTAQAVGPLEVGARVQLARVGERLIAYPLHGPEALRHPADGVVEEVRGEQVRLRPCLPPEQLEGRAVVLGCDPLLGLAAGRTGGRVLWRPVSSAVALAGLARGEAHAAGLHLFDAASGESNAPFVRAALPGLRVRLITLWSWEQGLIVAPGNPLGLGGPSDLGRPGLRLVNREPGAGSRLLLDAWLQGAGLEPGQLSGYARELPGHLELASAVARGEADAGPGPRSAAQALGLGFVSVQRERFDLAVPEACLLHPGVQALLATLSRPDFQTELTALGGYDASGCGQLWQTVG